MPMYEIETTYCENQYGKCWLAVDAADKEDAIAQVELGEYEWIHHKVIDIGDLEINTSELYSIREIT